MHGCISFHTIVRIFHNVHYSCIIWDMIKWSSSTFCSWPDWVETKPVLHQKPMNPQLGFFMHISAWNRVPVGRKWFKNHYQMAKSGGHMKNENASLVISSTAIVKCRWMGCVRKQPCSLCFFLPTSFQEWSPLAAAWRKKHLFWSSSDSRQRTSRV